MLLNPQQGKIKPMKHIKVEPDSMREENEMLLCPHQLPQARRPLQAAK